MYKFIFVIKFCVLVMMFVGHLIIMYKDMGPTKSHSSNCFFNTFMMGVSFLFSIYVFCFIILYVSMKKHYITHILLSFA